MQKKTGPLTSRIIRILLVIAILSVGVGISVYWFKNKPSTKRGRPSRQARLVEVTPLALRTENVVIHAMGTVFPSQKVQVSFSVAGKIVWINPKIIPGGFLSTGELIAKIDSKDYEINLEQKRAEFAKVQADKEMEMGQQAIARKEIEFLDQNLPEADKSLMLRKPQLEKIKAAVNSASSAVQKAELDLTRTSIFTPFNSIIQAKHVEVGTLASVGSPVGTIYGNKEYWIEVLVPQDDLKWIEIPGINSTKGSQVRIYNEQVWNGQRFRTGDILKMKPELDPNSRMAYIIVKINDPLDLEMPMGKRLPLLSGSYVKIAILGKEMKDIIKIKRNYVRDGNMIFLMKKPENILDSRKIEVIWSDATHIYTRDLLAGEYLVTTDIGSPIDGMALRTAEMQGDKLETDKTGHRSDRVTGKQKGSRK